jgi:hypothetical protein
MVHDGLALLGGGTATSALIVLERVGSAEARAVLRELAERGGRTAHEKAKA